MDSQKSFCPVPEEQQPLNEFRQLQESWFFRWATLPLVGFLKPLLGIWGLGLVVAAPVAAASYLPGRFPLQFSALAIAGAALPPLFALLQLYLGWRYVRTRLNEPKVFYEESGWYDGQYWTKPQEVLVQDRLVVTYEIQPMLRRLEKTFGVIGLVFFVGAIGWQFL